MQSEVTYSGEIVFGVFWNDEVWSGVCVLVFHDMVFFGIVKVVNIN